MAFALQLRKKHGKTSVRVAGECQLAKSIQNRAHVRMCIARNELPWKHNCVVYDVILNKCVF